jgi:tellurite resistance protein TerC
METIGTWWMWAGFTLFVLIAIGVDLLVMEKQGAHKVTMKEATVWSIMWFSLAFVFVALLWWYLDGSQGRAIANRVSMEFVTGYLVEKCLFDDFQLFRHSCSVPKKSINHRHHWCNRA